MSELPDPILDRDFLLGQSCTAGTAASRRGSVPHNIRVHGEIGMWYRNQLIWREAKNPSTTSIPLRFISDTFKLPNQKIYRRYTNVCKTIHFSNKYFVFTITTFVYTFTSEIWTITWMCLTLQNATNDSFTELASEQPEEASVFSSDFCFAREKNSFYYIKFLNSLNFRLIV